MIVMAMMLMLMLLPSAFSLFRWPKVGNAGVGVRKPKPTLGWVSSSFILARVSRKVPCAAMSNKDDLKGPTSLVSILKS